MTGRDPQPEGRADDRYREWDAAYVLGALSAAERREYEQHLRTCDACRAAVGELAGLPALLRTVPPDEALAADVPAAASSDADADVVELATVARHAHRARRRRTLALVAAAAALLVVGGTGGVLVGRATGAAEPPVADVTRLDLRPTGAFAVTADLRMESRPWGTRLDWSCSYPAGAWEGGAGPVYELVAVDDEGSATVVATWLAYSSRAAGLQASTSLPTDDIARLEIRAQGDDTRALAAADT